MHVIALMDMNHIRIAIDKHFNANQISLYMYLNLTLASAIQVIYYLFE